MRIFSIALALCAALCAGQSLAGLSIQGTRLVDGNGSTVVLRGVNHPHAWFAGETAAAIPKIAATGANSVRVVMAMGTKWSRTSAAEIQTIIDLCKQNNMIAVLEFHDGTGWGEESGTAHISDIADYWVSSDVMAVVKGEEDYVIINIANEPFGNGVSASTYTNDTIAAIQKLRNAGYTHTLMVDAANWGQDWENLMRDNAQTIFNGDSLNNTMFSVHMYQVYNTSAKVQSYMQAFSDKGLALVVGEFAADHFSEDVAEAAIMQYAEQFGFGYMGWSWTGNSSDLASLDIVKSFSDNTYTTWGNRLINGSNGIATTSRIASVYTGTSSGSSSSSSSSSNSSSSGGTSACSTGGSCDWSGTSFPLCESGNTNDWGYENGQSCVGVGLCDSNPDATTHCGTSSGGGSTSCGTTSDGHPVCCDAASDPDGDGWGWENEASCVVESGSSSSSSSSSSTSSSSSSSSSSSGSSAATCNWYGTQYPMCTSTSSGWGWENNQSCISPSTCSGQ